MPSDLLVKRNNYSFLEGGGETGELIRAIDWSSTPLGSPDKWSQSLKTCIRIILTSSQPMFVWWGKDLINIYNDAYIDIVRGKHPEALGQKASEVWHEIWDQVGPRADTVMQKNVGTYDEALLLIMERNGYPEETYYTFSYSPVPGDDGNTAGIICANTDDTDRIIGERHLRTLKDLGKGLINCKSNSEVFNKTIDILKQNQYDFPFAVIYEIDELGEKATMAGITSVDAPAAAKPLEIDLRKIPEIYRSMADAIISNSITIADDIKTKIGYLPSGGWKIPPEKTLILPISHSRDKRPSALMVVGMNPYRLPNEKYISFFRLISDQVATSLSHVHAYEQEKKRAEALAEIDKAKTLFFSNISHEFRTPLTLMLSPLEEIRKKENSLPADIKENIEVSYRNTLRLQKLVNTLLDFSRIEAGRMQAEFELVDIAMLTRDLASSFRSAIEKAGLKFSVHCEIPDEDVYVDISMWEKIILNLISNAFKYTHEGQIGVSLKQEGNQIKLQVRDTGIGIPVEEQDKIFERFHRIQNIKGRSQEGTGIGLALVQELIKLHHGVISVESKPDKGSIFTVMIPVGKDHLPDERIKTGTNGTNQFNKADAFIKEALKWTPSNPVHQDASIDIDHREASSDGQQQEKPFILLADDNADMRDYIKRLLTPAYRVITVENGKKALEKINDHIPDLIVSDVMMPELDGFELVKRLKSNTKLAKVPVLLLSARAGEEATLEGLQTGADDYLVKPFSARELISRINSTLKLAQSRKEAEQQYSDLFLQAPIAICMLKGQEMVFELANKKYLEISGKDESIISKPLEEALPELKGQAFPDILKNVYNTGIPYFGNEEEVYLNRYGKQEKRFINFVYHPVHNQNGSTYSILVIAYDVTELVEARQKLEEAEERVRIATDGTGLGTWDLNLLNGQLIYTPRLNEIFGYDRSRVLTHSDMRNHVHPDDRVNIIEKAFEEALRTSFYYYEARIVWDNGITRWIRTQGKVLFDETGKAVRMLGTMMDITEQKVAQTALMESEERYRALAQELDMRVQQRTKDLSEANESLAISNKELEQFAFVTSHDLQEPLRKIQTFANMLYERHRNQLDERAVSYLDKMMSASQRMSKLINDLLNFSRLRRSDESFASTDLNEVLSNIINDFELLISQKQAKIIADKLPVISANPLQMNQLFYNLISNALKFSKPDIPPVIEISCRMADKGDVMQIAHLDQGINYYEIIVRDNGIGFAQQYAEKIFEIFQRLNARSEYEGTGIGLALVNKIVEHHKGAIFAVSVEGEGSAFHLLLPEENK